MPDTSDILIVEDSPTQAEQLRHDLESEGYRVRAAKNGRDGLASLKERKAKVILSDINMPEMDGYQFCKAVKADPALSEIPVILMTNLVDSLDIIRGLECGASNFFTKPVDKPQLASRLRYLFANREFRRGGVPQLSLEFSFMGKSYKLDADRMQILDLLLSTYETAVRKNVELIRVQNELRHLNESLEAQVLERTAALTASNAELRAQIDSRKQAEEANLKLQSQLVQAQKMESIGRLAGGVAHDFNNILTAINGYAHFLITELKPGDSKRADAEEIKKAGERAAGLTRQLLAFSRQQVLQPKIVELNALIGNIGNMLRRIIGEDLTLASRLGENLGRVKVDPGQIEQVVLNLVVNARDAMPGGGTISILTANVEAAEAAAAAPWAVVREPHVMLSVSDTGTGMDEKTQARLFEPFFTTKEQGKGTGLGLSTVYGIVKQSGGQIAVESAPGKGTTFRIYLPRVAEEPHDEAPVETKEAGTPHGAATILLVEDDDVVRRYSARLLSERGYAVLEAADGAQAIRLSDGSKEPIHLLFTDLVMPGIRGDDLAALLTKKRPEMRVIFTSGYTSAGLVRQDSLPARAAFLQKPVDPAALLNAVRETLRESGA
ncbi:MAG TPA: response regulator [Elusimicrobiota bacterium]|nr:response regulator [Elusimicrobiota bacterium]